MNGIVGGGKVAQMVNVTSGRTTTASNIPFDATKPQSTEGAQLFTLAITPTNASSTLYIQFSGWGSSGSTAWMTVALFKDSGADAIQAATTYMATSTGGLMMILTHPIAAGSTSPQTFELRFGASSGTMEMQGSFATDYLSSSDTAVMTITEILP